MLIDVLANDAEGAVVSDVTEPAHGAATIEDGKIRYEPDGTWAGTDTFTYSVDVDGTPADNAATVSVTVTAADLDVADDDATAVAAATPLTIDVLANDSGENVEVTEVTTAGHGTVGLDDGVITYTSAAGFRGTDTFGYTATDALGRSATGQVTVHVPNALPTMTAPAPVTVVAGGTAAVPVTVGDANGDTLTVTAGSASGAGAPAVSVTISGTGASRSVRVNASQAAAGTASVPLTVSDGTGTAHRTLAVTVTPAAPIGVTAGVLPDPAALKAISKPVYSGGKPVARTLSTRIDSRITWRRSPTAGLTGYRVTVNGSLVCSAMALVNETQSCTLLGRALQRGDVVRVTAVAGALSSSAAVVPVVAGTADQRRLMAVVYFPTGEFKLDATATQVLGTVAAQAKQYGLTSLTLVGHTDADGSAASNLTLSKQRAGQVRDWMRARYSWVAGSATGLGESSPAVSNGTSAGKAANRRVEIYVG